MSEKRKIPKLPHHVQQKLCYTRPPYRQGKKLTSVKVYTVNDESQHLLICGVPQLQLSAEIEKLVCPFGHVKKIHIIPEYPTEEFTEVYHVQYACIQSARIAKRFIDGKNFFGGSLHVFYAPELESISETKAKLSQRHRDVAIRIKRNQQDTANPQTDKFIPKKQYHRRKKTPALPLTEERLIQHYPGETLTSIYDGIPQNIDPRSVYESSLPSTSNGTHETNLSVPQSLEAPYNLNEAVLRATSRLEVKSKFDFSREKRKNYKGQSVNNNIKVRIVRPQIIDTTAIMEWNSKPPKNIYSNPKKVDNNITIKLIQKNENERKRIVIKNPRTINLVQPSEDLQTSIHSAKIQIRTAMQARDKN